MLSWHVAIVWPGLYLNAIIFKYDRIRVFEGKSRLVSNKIRNISTRVFITLLMRLHIIQQCLLYERNKTFARE